MNQDPVTVDRIQSERVFPPLQLVHAARQGFTIQVMLPTLAAILILDAVFGPQPGLWSMPNPFSVIRDRYLGGVLSRELIVQTVNQSELDLLFPAIPAPLDATAAALRDLIRSGLSASWSGVLYAATSILILMVAGTAAARSTALDFCRKERCGALRSVWTAFRRFRQVLSATILALVLLWLPWSLCFGLGWMITRTGLGSLVPGPTGAVLWLASFLVCLWTPVIIASWFLALSAVAVDDCEGADALSRGINYCLSHRLRTLCYFVLILMTTCVSGELVRWFCSYASMAASVFCSENPTWQQTGEVDGFGFPVYFGNHAAKVLDAFRLGTFFCGTTIAYLLLRQREDGILLTEMATSLATSGPDGQ